MKHRLGRLLVRAVVSVAALGAAGVGGLYFYAGSGPVRQRIAEGLGDALGMPVSVGGVSFTPWDGLALRDVRVAETGESGAPAFAETGEIRARIGFGALLRNEIEIKEIVVTGPRVSIREDESGRVAAPRLERRKPEAEQSGEPAVAETPTERREGVKPARQGPKVRVGPVRIERGEVVLRDSGGKERLRAAGLSARAAVGPEGVVAGVARADRVQVEGGWEITLLQSPFTWTSSGLELPEISGEIAGGKLSGAASVGAAAPHEFRVSLRLNGADLSELASDKEGRTAGRMRAELDLRGDAADISTLRGKGAAEITQGRFPSSPILQTLGILLEVPELVNLEISRARAEFRIKGNDIRLDQLEAESENLRLTGSGSVKDFEKLSIDARLHASPGLRARLPGETGQAFNEPGEDGWMSMPFDIRGTVRSPKTNLRDKLLRRAAREAFGGLLNDLLSPGGGERQAEEPGGEEAAGAGVVETPQVTPVLPAELAPSLPPPTPGNATAPEPPPAAPAPR